MNLVGTKKVKIKDRIFHREGCIYAKKIKAANAKYKTVNKIEGYEKCKCAYCAGLKGELRLNRDAINRKLTKTTKLHYDDTTETLYISTDVGFWKIFYKVELGKYLLYHRNVYNTDMSLSEAKSGEYHRQKDAKANERIIELISYVIAHDNAKKIIASDYKKLPKETRKQKQYYHMVAKRERIKSAKRLDDIFLILEKQDKGFKQLSYS